MPIIEALPAFSDNYIWLLQDSASRRCAVVDPGDAEPVLRWLEQHPDWQLSDILITHHHHDHVGGVLALKERTGARVLGPAHEQIPGRDMALDDGDQVAVLGRSLQIIAVPGHTLGHIAYYDADANQPVLFSGDTLFAAGCGRLFEGTPEQMFQSLTRLAALPQHTQVFCTHEYTLSNLRFARAVEPDNPAIEKRFQDVSQLREAGRCSLPSTLALEQQTNPFLRTADTAVAHSASVQAGYELKEEVAVFAALRSWKDRF
ncbi:MAG TPA: hydroxyacylglutathione hydrolase [Pseudomonas sp.]|uniref:hydroxyacylglutathione hydrolase n=1 Tax=Stutzerimonas balearica TaxID=74829 RepID=UPI000C40FA2F|nr:hydroxyacylglutathione hydrolase [Pseudomonas sp.]HAF92438.1 hydroxyacylglutathione hydrolase [Pseudomonas sp.]|tara:strand:- start:626 stop:1405 length:780 start_codon:yes stop_codon:yes gene_type:complete